MEFVEFLLLYVISIDNCNQRCIYLGLEHFRGKLKILVLLTFADDLSYCHIIDDSSNTKMDKHLYIYISCGRVRDYKRSHLNIADNQQ